jgi:membrane protein DedA with SNARE-associated domain
MAWNENQLILLGLFFVVAINEDSAVISAALLSYKRVFPAWEPFVACLLGMWISDFAIYSIGRFGGSRLLDSRWSRRVVSAKHLEQATKVCKKWGGFATVFSRLILGTRTAILAASGLLRYPAHKFLMVTFAAAVGWLLLVYSLFNLFGLAAAFLFGFRWIIALAVMLLGGAGATFLVVRSGRWRRPQGSETGHSKRQSQF